MQRDDAAKSHRRWPAARQPWTPRRPGTAHRTRRSTAPRTPGGPGCATRWPRSRSSPRPRRWSAGTPSTSWSRQVKHIPAIAALEAGIPDAGALIFAALGIALALHGRRALRPRSLNVACVAISLAMNAMAAGRGWRDIAIWVMPAAVYALASDTLIGVVRAWALARMQATGQDLAGDEVTPLAVAGAVLLWLLRLSLAPASTLSGFRRWVIEECPVAPGRTAPATPPPAPLQPSPPASRQHLHSAGDGARTASQASRTC